MLKYPEFNITPQHLGIVLRDNNITRKRTKHQHFPKTRYGIETDKKKELDTFYNEISKYPLDKIICLDEIFSNYIKNIYQKDIKWYLNL